MGVPVQPAASSVDSFIDAFGSNSPSSRALTAQGANNNNNSNISNATGLYLLESLEAKLDVFEQQLVELNKYNNKLTEEYSHKVVVVVVVVRYYYYYYYYHCCCCCFSSFFCYCFFVAIIMINTNNYYK